MLPIDPGGREAGCPLTETTRCFQMDDGSCIPQRYLTCPDLPVLAATLRYYDTSLYFHIPKAGSIQAAYLLLQAGQSDKARA